MRKNKLSFHPTERRPLALPAEISGNGPFIELRGRHEVAVQGCRKILISSPEVVRLALRESVLTVRGRGLCCMTYFAGAVAIRGVIAAVAFEDEEGET